MALSTLTLAHRRDLAELTGLAEKDLSLIWAQFDSADMARDGLMKVLPELVDVYGSAAATLGADWYDEMRDTAKVKGRFRAIPAELPDVNRTDALARWGVSPLFQAEPDFTTALSKVAGGLQRIIFNADRETVRVSSIEDPKARGWMRVGHGECDWCKKYLDGEVHYVGGYSFDAHDKCRCTADPVFD
jgi:hypothetical protein